MKLIIIGLGQCGGRIADEFARLNSRARAQHGIEIVIGAYAVNTDITDLSGLKRIKPDYEHRILIGGRKTGGHGVGKINELGEVTLHPCMAIARVSSVDGKISAQCGGGEGAAVRGDLGPVPEHLADRAIKRELEDLLPG